MHRGGGLALVMAAVFLLPGAALAGGGFVIRSGPVGFFARGSFSGGEAAVAGGVFSAVAIGFSAAGNTYPGGWREDPATLIVDASPSGAMVFLDGRPLGTAGELVARGLPLSLGPHVIEVQAPGYRTRAWQFVADGSFPVRVRATLSAE